MAHAAPENGPPRWPIFPGSNRPERKQAMSDQVNGLRKEARIPTPTILDAEGNPVSIRDLPLVAFRLTCGHLGRDYGIQARDIVFCDDCGTNKRVKKVLAA